MKHFCGGRAARDIEAQSRDFYLERAKHAHDPALRDLMQVIACEEERHYRILNGLMEFVREAADWFEGPAALKADALDFWVCVTFPLPLPPRAPPAFLMDTLFATLRICKCANVRSCLGHVCMPPDGIMRHKLFGLLRAVVLQPGYK